MTETDVIALADRFQSAMNAHDAEAAGELFAPHFVDHAPWPGQTPDLAGFRSGLAAMLEAFPDLHIDMRRVVGNGDLVAWHFAISGSHLGLFMGAEPTGRSFRVEAMDMLRVENGRIAEHWGVIDSTGMAEQLGLG